MQRAERHASSAAPWVFVVVAGFLQRLSGMGAALDFLHLVLEGGAAPARFAAVGVCRSGRDLHRRMAAVCRRARSCNFPRAIRCACVAEGHGDASTLYRLRAQVAGEVGLEAGRQRLRRQLGPSPEDRALRQRRQDRLSQPRDVIGVLARG